MVEGTDAALETSLVNRRTKRQERKKEKLQKARARCRMEDSDCLFPLLLFGLGLWKYLGNKSRKRRFHMISDGCSNSLLIKSWSDIMILEVFQPQQFLDSTGKTQSTFFRLSRKDSCIHLKGKEPNDNKTDESRS